MGLANRADRPFPHDITESDELLQTMRRHKVTARHGDIFDPLSYEGDRDLSGLSDAIELDLIGRFVTQAEETLGPELPDATVVALGEIDHFRPLLLVPAWLDGLLERTCPQPALRKRVKQLWDRLAEELLSSQLVRERDASSSASLLDGFGGAEVQQAAFDGLVGGHAGLAGDSRRGRRFLRPPFPERAGLPQSPRAARGLRAYARGGDRAAGRQPCRGLRDGADLLQRRHLAADVSPGRIRAIGEEFIATDVFGYLAFFQGDERKGRAFETWSGTLGHTPTERRIHRIDAAHALPASRLAIEPPHFASLLSNARLTRP